MEAPDETGHQGLLKEKIQAIEDFDQKIVGPIFQGLQESGEEFRLIATMDHHTPLCLRTHTASPVPTLLYDSRKTDKGCGLPFNEHSAKTVDEHLHNGMANGELLMEKLLQRKHE